MLRALLVGLAGGVCDVHADVIRSRADGRQGVRSALFRQRHHVFIDASSARHLHYGPGETDPRHITKYEMSPSLS